ncbi:hypothetical protein [Roseofilum sp. Guam]|uniref:hypothetical protein n=1 Tax=Roseofilum sp. Guam TaxID=2821502 RepID=UPI001B24E599|nr:hypothetical protein [Roseofilum sp. Guam]MBP0026826.1 hypothetical protein [Roseofilum sp. Guam]
MRSVIDTGYTGDLMMMGDRPSSSRSSDGYQSTRSRQSIHYYTTLCVALKSRGDKFIAPTLLELILL